MKMAELKCNGKTQSIASGLCLKTLFAIIVTTILRGITIPEGISVTKPAIIFVML